MDIQQFRDSPAGRVVRALSGYWAFVPHPLPPVLDFTPALVLALSEADPSLGELRGTGRTLANPYLLIRPFVYREAVLSSRIEGTQASLTDLFAYEALQLPLFDESPPAGSSDVLEVANYVRAMEYGLERLKSLPLSLRLIRELHEQLTRGVRGGHLTPGEFRRGQNWIGAPGCDLSGATFVPPPAQEMTEALDALEKFLYQSSDLPALVQLALVHYQFEAIHPFLDGNGRIGRLLMTLMLVEKDLLRQPLLYLSAYFEKHRQEYYDRLLAVSRKGDWEGWVAFFLRGVADQSCDAIARSQRLQDLHQKYRARFQVARSSAFLLRVVDEIFASPVLSITSLKGRLNSSFEMARRAVGKLVEAGIVREVSGQRRRRLFAAHEILAILDSMQERQ